MANITKRLCLPVGNYTKQGAPKPTVEYREIGVLVEFSDTEGNTWAELRLHLDILNPVLAGLAMRQGNKGESSCRVKLFDVARKVKAPGEESPPPEVDEDGIPF